MPKVKTEKMRYEVPDGRGGVDYKDFIKEVKINNDSGTFSMRTPPEVRIATGQEEVTAKTLKEVEEAFRKVMDDYKSCQITKKKVIVYHFSYSSQKTEEARVSYSGYGLMFEIRSGVFIESIGISKGGVTSYEYELLKSPLEYAPHIYSGMYGAKHGREERLIEWTQENESFFVYLQENMERLIKMAHELQNPAKLLECISTGYGFLMLNAAEGGNPDGNPM